jgi:23S rRNA pseudouridine2605 synthase
MTDEQNHDLNPESTNPEPDAAAELVTPTTDGPQSGTGTELEAEAFAEVIAENESEAASAVEPEFTPAPRPPAKLERLQKILAAAGVASRRSAEAMIEQGRVQVNGKVVTELGTKADAGRDHIRVDGKLLQGAERLRYFVLNKPKGFVTTVKDPEGRPTVMQFFDKLKERLYPVGRLDYMSEGLLLVTNDGELANRLTKASSGVEKTYLVKVAGQPTEAELDILRAGVSIERGKPGSGQVRTSPARIRQVRQGDNPWYEVVLIEGRNRELRKMFEEIGHFVEKIRRTGYGPLVLDQEPGNMRELNAEELDSLRKAAEGKLRTPKSKELRRRNLMDAGGLPTVTPKPTVHPRPAKPFRPKPFEDRAAASDRPGDLRPKKAFGSDKAKPFRPAASGSSTDRPRRAPSASPAKYGPPKFDSAGPAKRPFRRAEAEGSFTPRPPRPAWKKDDRPARPPARFAAGSTGESRPRPDRPSSVRPRPDRPGAGDSAGRGRTGGGRNFGAKPAWNNRAAGSDRPAYKRPDAPRRPAPSRDEDLGPVRPPNLRIEEVSNSDRPSPSRSSAPRPGTPRSYSDRANTARPNAAPSGSDRPASNRPPSNRPFRGEGGLARPFTTSSGKPRAGGARPSSKPGKPGGTRSYGAAPKRPFRRDAGEGSFTPRPSAGPRGEGSRPERKTDTGWKPKTRYGPGKSGSGAGFKSKSAPKSGGFSRPGSKGPGFKARPSGSGPKRNGPGGKKRGPEGKKR